MAMYDFTSRCPVVICIIYSLDSLIMIWFTFSSTWVGTVEIGYFS